MADAAAARREARRKKILENSQNRLHLISGKSSEQWQQASSPVRTFHHEEPHEIKAQDSSSSPPNSLFINGLLITDPATIEYSLPNHNTNEAGDSESEYNSTGPGPTTPAPEQAQQEHTVWEKLISSKYDVVILSLFLQVFYSFTSFAYTESYFFLPLIVHIAMKLIWFPPRQQSSFANALLLLHGMSPARVQKLLQIAQLVTVFSQDVCVFLFTTICIQALYAFASERIHT